MRDKEMIAVFHYDDDGTNRCGAEPYRYAEEIVRCKSCKHYELNGACMRLPRTTLGFKPDGFCSYGERKKDE